MSNVSTPNVFFNIGKAVLYKAVGLQDNYINEMYVKEKIVDLDASGCKTCQAKIILDMFPPGSSEYETAMKQCSQCQTKIMMTSYTKKKEYVNEKNRYGYLPRLSLNALKLLLLCHNYSNNEGLIINVTYEDAAKAMHCSSRTVKNSLYHLKQLGYLSAISNNDGTFCAYITAKKSYYLPATRGGRGYLTITQACLTELLRINTVNALRIALRTLMDLDKAEHNGILTCTKTYETLRRVLPYYCKRNIIKKNLEQCSNIFTFEITKKNVILKAKEQFRAKEQKKYAYTIYSSKIKTYSNKLNDCVNFVKNDDYIAIEGDIILKTIFDNIFSNDIIKDSKSSSKLSEISLTEKDISDLTRLAIDFSLSDVNESILEIYKTYYLVGKQKKIRQLGAVARRIILSKYKADNLTNEQTGAQYEKEVFKSSKNSFCNILQRDYDFDELEKALLRKNQS